MILNFKFYTFTTVPTVNLLFDGSNKDIIITNYKYIFIADITTHSIESPTSE